MMFLDKAESQEPVFLKQCGEQVLLFMPEAAGIAEIWSFCSEYCTILQSLTRYDKSVSK